VRILYFADTRFPIERANGLQTMATCHALAARGHRVTLATRPDTAAPARDPFAFYALPRIAALTFDPIGASGPPAVRRVRFLLASARRMQRRDADVIFTRDLGVAAFLSSWPPSVRPPLVYESHGIAAVVSAEMPALLGRPELTPSTRKLNRLDSRDRRVWRRAASYVTITKSLADDLANRYGPRDGVFVAPDGAAPSAPLAMPDGPPVAGYAGHLYPWKGADVLVRALALAPGVRGLIVGGHSGEADLDRISALVQALGLASRVELTGRVAPADVRARLAAATMLVLPNTRSIISERYTSPLKLFEYLAMGRPIIASDLASIREVLHDGRTGLLVPPDDPAALAAAMTRLAGDRDLSARLASEAAALAPRYTWGERAARVEAALRSAVGDA
jgi:glycosyltransferase involved in cell wall biosynthesis